MPSRAVMSLRAVAISSACARLSSAHGPAIKASGSLLPKRTLPTATVEFGFAVINVLADDHEGGGEPGQPAHFTADIAVGRKNALLILAMIGPSFSLSSRALCHAGSA